MSNSAFRFRTQHMPMALFALFTLFILVFAQTCSKLNPCATGCCSKFGYCGTDPEHCSPENCVDTCDFKLGCDSKNPCKSGCCSKFGFCGLGPDYCAPEVCVAGCDSKSYCDPGYGPEWAEVATCPLNVCCSKWGYCGITSEFCGDKKVQRPSCSGMTKEFRRVVGYYEGWSSGRPCNKFWPEQIPLGVYTHINFAFATIDPHTYEIKPSSRADTELYKRLTSLKRLDPDLKVYIAIGGWTFNDPDQATRMTFSEIAASDQNQATFIRSLISFMSTYDFDGVDIDWEYPQAPDRGGLGRDFKNFPAFMKNLKSALRSTGGRDGLTITIPASYWYLQHFDLKDLARHVDFFNVMSYDMHGAWDKGNKWVGNFLNAHTNLTEITDALDLLWRNDINPDQVVLGLAFYGRVFSATSRSCMTPGCTFESGGNKGPCSGEVGVLLNSEIDNIVSQKGLSPVLFEDEAVKVATWDDQWVAFDDKETLDLKVKFANSQCLSGVMVWAISHDTQDGKYSVALAQATKRQLASRQSLPELDEVSIFKNHGQCLWTQCGGQCPANYQWMPRSDKGKRNGERMVEHSNCGGDMHQKLCCPIEEGLPTCGWYGFHGGKCQGACPDEMTEVGSTSESCNNRNNGGYQAACCTINNNATALYDQCSWGAIPACDNGVCTGTQQQLITANKGSGAAWCKHRSSGLAFDLQERKYCCAQGLNSKWMNCEWSGSVGPVPPGVSNKNMCRPGCPNSKVQVGVGLGPFEECGGGARSMCCDADRKTVEWIENPVLTEARNTLKDWWEQGNCIANGDRQNEQLEWGIDLEEPMLIGMTDSQNSDLQASIDFLSDTVFHAQDRITTTRNEKIWGEALPQAYSSLTISVIRSIQGSDLYIRENPREVFAQILCTPWIFTNFAKSSEPYCPASTIRDLCDIIDGFCLSEEDIEGISDERFLSDEDLDIFANSTISEEGLEPERRGKARQQTLSLILAQALITWWSWPYRSPSQIKAGSNILNWAVTWDNDIYSLCHDPLAQVTSYEYLRRLGRKADVEHVFDIHNIEDFFNDTLRGVLPGGRASRFGRAPEQFFAQGLTQNIIEDPPQMPGTSQNDTVARSAQPASRIMAALGTNFNQRSFLLLDTEIHTVKTQIFNGNDPIDDDVMLDLTFNDRDHWPALLALGRVMSAFHYMDIPFVREAMINILGDVRREIQLAQAHWNARPGAEQINLVHRWDEWVPEFFLNRQTNVQAWIRSWISIMRNEWRNYDTDAAREAERILTTLESRVPDLILDFELDDDVD